jgi:hypothetical protein
MTEPITIRANTFIKARCVVTKTDVKADQYKEGREDKALN